MDASEEQAARETAAELKKTIATVRSPAEAAEVLDEAESVVGDGREEDVLPTPGPRPETDSPAPALVEAAKEATEVNNAEVVDKAVEHLHGDAQSPAVAEGRHLLQNQLLRRLQPFDAADTAIFLGINRLPHPPVADRFFRSLSWFMTGGHAWGLVPMLEAPCQPKRAFRVAVLVMPAIWLTTALLEYPVKHFFRRRRPFVSIVRSIVVGRKPGSYSFPSGHSAAAFGGAVLLARYYPRASKGFLMVAGLVGFSRVYLGAHYPGDVVTGGVVGVALGRLFRGAIGWCLGRTFRRP